MPGEDHKDHATTSPKRPQEISYISHLTDEKTQTNETETISGETYLSSLTTPSSAPSTPRAPSPPRWRFISEAKKSSGYNSSAAGTKVGSDDELDKEEIREIGRLNITENDINTAEGLRNCLKTAFSSKYGAASDDGSDYNIGDIEVGSVIDANSLAKDDTEASMNGIKGHLSDANNRRKAYIFILFLLVAVIGMVLGVTLGNSGEDGEIQTGKALAVGEMSSNTTASPSPSTNLQSENSSPSVSYSMHPSSSVYPTQSPSNSIHPTLIPVTSLSPTASYLPPVTSSLPPVTPSLPPVLPSQSPVLAPTFSPVETPTFEPTKHPTLVPVQDPTEAPISSPTSSPTPAPTQPPTPAPVQAPTFAPVKEPTLSPVKDPTIAPTQPPTLAPVQTPTLAPIKAPTASPATIAPTESPTPFPSNSPTVPCTPRIRRVKIISTTCTSLQIMEVQVISSGVNVAIGKPAVQTSTYIKSDGTTLDASLATDGDLTTFSHTEEECAWWMVDLEEMITVESVLIANRYCENNPECLCRLSYATVQLIGGNDEIISEDYLGDTCGDHNVELFYDGGEPCSVNCGVHEADNCAACIHDKEGTGEAWCHGECSFNSLLGTCE